MGAISAGQGAAGQQPALPAAPADPADDAADSELYFGARLPSDRPAERALDVARELVAAGRFADAVAIIDERLAAPADSAAGPDGSLRRAFRELLASLPDGGLRAYRLRVENDARRRLAEGDDPAELAARFPPEASGLEAWLALATREADRGAYAAAAEIVLRLEQALPPGQRTRVAPLLAVLRAHSLTDAPHGELGGAIDRAALADAYAAAATGREAWRDRRPPRVWLGPAGSADRAGAAAPAPPRPWLAWRASLDDPARPGARAFAGVEPNGDQSAPRVCARGVIVAGGVVAARTSDAVVAFDASTGKLLWRSDSSLAAPRPRRLRWTLGDDSAGFDSASVAAWFDRVGGALTSDGRRVFAIGPALADDLREASRRSAQASPGPAMLMSMDDREEPVANAVYAFDIAAQGKLAWTLDRLPRAGGDEAPQPLYCLGTPVADEGRLWLLAEAAETIHLVQLDAATGRVAWSQPIAEMERGVAENPSLRLLGASPTVTPGGGLVVCPTGAGLIVAVDPWRREIVWTHRARVEADRLRDYQRRGWRGSFLGGGSPLEDGHGWREARAVVAGDAVVFVSPESPRLNCVDRATGALRWSHLTTSGVLLAGVIADAAVVIEERGVSAWPLAGGRRRVRATFPEGDGPSGEGVFVGRDYFVPLASGRLARAHLDPPDEEPSDGARTPQRACELAPMQLDPLEDSPCPGSLAIGEGRIYCGAPERLDCFELASRDAEDGVLGEALRRLEDGGAPPEAGAADAATLTQTAEGRRLASALGLAAGRPDEVPTPSGPQSRLLLAAERFAAALNAGDRQRACELAPELLRRRGMIEVAVDRSVSTTRWVAGAAARGELGEGAQEAARRLADEASSLEALTGVAEAFAPLETRVGSAARLAAALARASHDADARRWRAIAAATRGSDPPATASAPSTDTPWAVRQLDVAVRQLVAPAPTRSEPPWRQRGAAQTNEGSKPLGVAVARPAPPDGPAAWRLHAARGERRTLVGLGRRGEPLLGLSLPLALEPSPSGPAIGQVGPRQWGSLLAIRIGERVCLIDASLSREDSPVILWAGGAPPGSMTRLVSLRGAGPPPGDSRVGPALEDVAAMGPWGVVTTAGRAVTCYDLSGEVAWRRNEAVPVVSALAAGDQLCLVDRERGAVRVVSAWDGALLREGVLPAGDWLADAEGNLLVAESDAPRLTLRIVRLATQETLWRSEYPSGADVVPLDGLLAVMQPAGPLELVDVAAGGVRFARALPWRDGPEPLIDARIVSGRLFVQTGAVDGASSGGVRRQGLGGGPLVTGSLWAIDPRSGAPLWPGPAEIVAQTWLDPRLAESPALVLGRRETDITADTGDPSSLRLLLVDCASGRALARVREQTTSTSEDCWAAVEGAPLGGERLVVAVGDTRVTLATAEVMAPPRPPANDRIEARDGPQGSDLMGVGRDLGRFFESMITVPTPP